jgi:threonine dehydrogenase-like Zn-dependent dehydrogenase
MNVAQGVYFVAPQVVEIRERPLEPQKDAILVRSLVQGISAGTELYFYRGDFPSGMEGDLPGLSKRLEYPLVYGYSNVGMDERGRRVFCFAPHQTGWYASEADLIILDDSISNLDAVFLPNMETALGILQDLQPILGETIAVMGLGVVGLLVAELLSRQKWINLILVDMKESRRPIAESLGADFINPQKESLAEAVQKLTGGRGLDRAVNVSASASALQDLMEVMAMEGLIIEASWYGSRPVSLSLGGAFHRRRLTIKSSQVSNVGGHLGPGWNKKRRMELVLRALSEIQPRRYVTDHFPFAQAPRAYEYISEGHENTIQVVLDCEEL